MDNVKVKELMKRVYNNKMNNDEKTGISDEKDINELCKKVFNNGSSTPDPSLLHNFNNILVETANEVAKKPVTDIIALLANMQTRNRGDVVLYDIPQNNNVKMVWSALGSGVDLIRIGNKKKIQATPKNLQFGVTYEPLDMVKDSVTTFNETIDKIAEAKVKMYLNAISDIIKSAIATSKIPSKNVKNGTDLPISDFRSLESVIARYGKPVFMADELLIQHFADLIPADSMLKTLMTDDVKKLILSSTNITQLSRSIAVPFSNPYIIGSKNEKTEIPVDKGYMVAGGEGKKPIYITEFGGMRQNSEQDPEDERIKVLVKQEADVTLISGDAIGYVEDDKVIA